MGGTCQNRTRNREISRNCTIIYQVTRCKHPLSSTFASRGPPSLLMFTRVGESMEGKGETKRKQSRATFPPNPLTKKKKICLNILTSILLQMFTPSGASPHLPRASPCLGTKWDIHAVYSPWTVPLPLKICSSLSLIFLENVFPVLFSFYLFRQGLPYK